MKRISAENLYPMAVSPSNFCKGDVVKKIYGDSIVTPYVGVVNRPIPSTNKVEVQWPNGIGLEDPWDLTKVNPLINPPVVQEDLSQDLFKSFKETAYNQSYPGSLQHYSVLNDFVNENIVPVIYLVANLYNEGKSKKEAALALRKASSNKEIVASVLDKIFDDSLNIVRSNVIEINGEGREASVSLIGNSDEGFTVSYSLGKNIEKKSFESVHSAIESFKDYETILASLDNKSDYEAIVSKVAKEQEESKKVGSSKEHVRTLRLADIDIILNDLHKSMQDE